MWIMLNDAFLSIVQKPDDKDTLTVRARVKGHIERVFPGVQATADGGTDYAYRAKVDRKLVAETMATEVMRVKYSNFKSSVIEDSLHDAYMGCWNIMNRLQQFMAKKPRATQRKRQRALEGFGA